MSVFQAIWLLIRAMFRDRTDLAVENLALPQQLAILKPHARVAVDQASSLETSNANTA